MHPSWDKECLTSPPKQKTDQASRVTEKGSSFTFKRTKTILSSPTYPAETAATLGRQSCDFFFFFLLLRSLEAAGLRWKLKQEGKARNLDCRAHHWAGIPELNFWKAHYSGLGRKWHWGVEGVNRSSRQSVHQSCCGAFTHPHWDKWGSGVGVKSYDSHKSAQPVSLYRCHCCISEAQQADLFSAFPINHFEHLITVKLWAPTEKDQFYLEVRFCGNIINNYQINKSLILSLIKKVTPCLIGANNKEDFD